MIITEYLHNVNDCEQGDGPVTEPSERRGARRYTRSGLDGYKTMTEDVCGIVYPCGKSRPLNLNLITFFYYYYNFNMMRPIRELNYGNV